MKKENIFRVLAVTALIIFFSLGLEQILSNSLNNDERAHITAGYAYVTLNDYSFNIEHPPLVKQLCALPLLFLDLTFPVQSYEKAGRNNIQTEYSLGIDFLYKMGNDLDLMLLFSRLPNLFIGLLLGVFIYLFTKDIFGSSGALLALLLFVASPNFIVHSSLITTDVANTCFYFSTFYLLWKFFNGKNSKYLYMAGISFGLALVSKYNSLIMIPVFYFLVSIAVFMYPEKENKYSMKPVLSVKNVILLILLLLTISAKWSTWAMVPAIVMIMSAYILPMGDGYKKKMHQAGSIILLLLILGFTITILDYTDFKGLPFSCPTKSYFGGFSSFRGHSQGGQISYLLGTFSDKGWWYYFPVAIALKTPLPTLILFVSGLIVMIKRKSLLKHMVFLLVPAAVYLFVACFVNKVNIGVRHVLPLYPFMFVVAGSSVLAFRNTKWDRAWKILLAGFVVWLVLIMAFSRPAYLSYFNRIIGNTQNGYKYLGDSNIAWGLDTKRLGEYARENSIDSMAVLAGFAPGENFEYYGVPARPFSVEEKTFPSPGYYVVETTCFYKKDIKWLNDFSPYDHVGDSLVVYKVDDVEKN